MKKDCEIGWRVVVVSRMKLQQYGGLRTRRLGDSALHYS